MFRLWFLLALLVASVPVLADPSPLPVAGASPNMPALGAVVAGAGVVITVIGLVARRDARRIGHDPAWRRRAG